VTIFVPILRIMDRVFLVRQRRLLDFFSWVSKKLTVEDRLMQLY